VENAQKVEITKWWK